MILLCQQRNEKMREVKIIKQKVLDNDCIIFPISYFNPLSKVTMLEIELVNNVGRPCKALVDLLLCNGENYNRFVSLRFDGLKIDKRSIEIIELSERERYNVNEFYRTNREIIGNGVLIPREYMKYVIKH